MKPTASNSRQAIVEAALASFLEHDFNALSMEQVRLKAGVSNGCLFHHFPTKNHLARAVYAGVLTEYQSDVLTMPSARASAKAGVQALVLRHIDWVVESPLHARLLIDLRAFTAVEDEEPAWASPNRRAYAEIKSWIAQRVQDGSMRDLPFEVWLALVIAPALHLTYGWVREADLVVPPETRQALASAAARSVCAD